MVFYPAMDVPQYALPLLERLIDSTDAPILLQPRDVLEFDSEVTMATPRHPMHVISYNRAYHDHALHFLVNGVYKILRFWDTPPEQRLVATSQANQRLPDKEERDMLRRMPGMSLDVMLAASRIAARALVRQVTSFPGDIRVEQSLHHVLPEHRPCQHAYLRRQILDLIPQFDPSYATMIPERCYRSTTAMNVAFMGELSSIVDLAIPEEALRSPHVNLGQQLRSHFQHAPPGYLGDRIISDAWAKDLDMEGWYEWSKHQ